MFTKTLFLAASALASLVAAQSQVLTFTHVPNPVTDGEPQAITYATNDTTHPVTIILRQGQQSNLDTIETLTTTATGGQYIWTPPKTLPNGNDYALEIKQGTQVNYFGPFIVQGASPAAISSAAQASSRNATMTAHGTGALGTGTTMHRNTTMSSPTLHKTTTAKTTSRATLVSTKTPGGAGGATSTQGAASSSSSGAAVAGDYQMGSSFAMLFGGAAAMLYYL